MTARSAGVEGRKIGVTGREGATGTGEGAKDVFDEMDGRRMDGRRNGSLRFERGRSSGCGLMGAAKGGLLNGRWNSADC